jgi:gamma-glutamyl-gamma-aminobutyrate hydrolase PuuD
MTVAELLQKWGELMPVLAFCGGVALFAVRFTWNVSRDLADLRYRLAHCESEILEFKAKKGAA